MSGIDQEYWGRIDMKKSLSRITFIIFSLATAAVGGYFFGDYVRLSEKPSEYIGLTFSILAASLFAVISIVGDPSMLLRGGWRIGWESAKSIQNRLQRLNILFVVYIITLGLLVITEIIEFNSWINFYFVHDIFAFFSIFGFLSSLALPFELARIQRDRLDQELNNRKCKSTDAGP